MAKLIIRDEHGVERTHDLPDGLTTVGRSSSNTIHVSDPKFSRNHFRIEKDGEYFRVIDLGSTNGTRINGLKVADQRLRPGDVLKVGATTFVYDGPGEPLPTPPPAADTLPDVHLTEGAAEAAPAEGPKYVLTVLEGQDPGKVYELGRDAITIGRHSSNTVSLDDESVSNYHAEIKKEPIGYVLSDLGSTNGTRVKARGAENFEKIVKTPLAVGMQIRAGKTVLEYRNVGAPSEDDQIFGTVVLEPEQLQDKLAERPARAGAGTHLLVGALAVVVFLVAVGLVLKLIPSDSKVKPSPVDEKVDLGNLVVGGDFSKPVDDRGNPPGWRAVKGHQAVRITVDPEQDASASLPAGQKKGVLAVQKSSAAAPSCRTYVECEESLKVDPSRVYEVAGALKNDGDGLCGLRVTWLRGERQFTQHPIVLVESQLEWKNRFKDLRPPPWADRALVAVFTEGREGKTCFDNISFRIKPDAEAPAAPSVSFNRVTLNYEGNTGAFDATADGQAVLEWAELELVGEDGKTVAGTLLSAIDPLLVQEGDRKVTGVRGELFDFTVQRRTGYKISAGPGAWGVEVRVAVNREADVASTPRLSFYVVGAAANGPVEALRGEQVETLAPADAQKLAGVREVLFNAGGAPQLYLQFTPPVAFETRREGRRRLVQLSFSGEQALQLAPENVAARQQLAQLIQDLDGQLAHKEWARASKRGDEIEQKYGSRFKEAKEAAARMRQVLEDAFKPEREALDDQVRAMPQTQAFDAVKEKIQKDAPAWVGTSYEKYFTDQLALVEQLRTESLTKSGEALAQKLLKQAQDAFGNKVYNVCASLCNKIIRDYPNARAATDARDLLAKTEAASKEQDLLNAITSRLKDRARPYTIAGAWEDAIRVVESDTEYRKYTSQLTELGELLANWRKKMQEK